MNFDTELENFDEVGLYLAKQIEHNTKQKVLGIVWEITYVPRACASIGYMRIRMKDPVDNRLAGTYDKPFDYLLQNTNVTTKVYIDSIEMAHSRDREQYYSNNTKQMLPWRDISVIYEQGKLNNRHRQYFKEIDFTKPAIYGGVVAFPYENFQKATIKLMAMNVWNTLKGEEARCVHRLNYTEPKQQNQDAKLREKYQDILKKYDYILYN